MNKEKRFELKMELNKFSYLKERAVNRKVSIAELIRGLIDKDMANYSLGTLGVRLIE